MTLCVSITHVVTKVNSMKADLYFENVNTNRKKHTTL